MARTVDDIGTTLKDLQNAQKSNKLPVLSISTVKTNFTPPPTENPYFQGRPMGYVMDNGLVNGKDNAPGVIPQTPPDTPKVDIVTGVPKVDTTPKVDTLTKSDPIQQYQGPNLIDLNAQLVEAQKKAKLAGLKNALDSGISNFNSQDALIDPKAYKDRAITSNQSQVGKLNFAEMLAARGQTNSGFANQSELNRNMQLASDIGGINLQATAQHNKIATDKTNLQNAYNNDVEAAKAGIEADSLQRQIQLAQDERNRQDQLSQFEKNYGINLAGLTGKINGQDTMAKQGQNFSQGIDLANLTGNYNGQRTIQGQQLDNQNQQQNIANAWNIVNSTGKVDANTSKILGIPEGTSTLEAKRFESDQTQREFENTMSTNQFDETKAQNAFVRDMQNKGYTADQAQRKWENAYKTNSFIESVRQFDVSQGNWQKEMTYKQAQDKIDNALKSRQISNEQAQTSLQQMKFKADQDPDSLDNKYKQAQINALDDKSEAALRTKAAQLATTSEGTYDPSVAEGIYKFLKSSNAVDFSGYDNTNIESGRLPKSAKEPQAYTPASQITDIKARQLWYTDNKTDIDKSMTTEELKAFKTKFNLK